MAISPLLQHSPQIISWLQIVADTDHWLVHLALLCTSPSLRQQLASLLGHLLSRSPRLSKRQSANPFQSQGPNFPVPYLAFAITAIALFVIIVCFVLLRIIMRNRRLRRLGLIPNGPFDRLLGPTREIEDTLTPPKLLEARIAHDARPAALDDDVKAKGWDAVMPISAAVPPVLYSDLFPKPKEQDSAADASGANTGAQNDFSYPPTSSPGDGRSRRLHVPAFLRRHGDGSHSQDGTSGAGPNGSGSDANANPSDVVSKPDTSTAASVNVTVLIAMPSQRTVFPSSQSHYNHAALKSQRSLNVDGIAADKIDEAEESVSGHQGGLRRTASIKSFRTAASAKSIGDARREAFFNKLNEGEANTVTHDLPATDMDDEELPELVFGTASVPIFSRIAGGSAAGREPFAGTLEAYQPLRSELIRLVTSAHEARERKVALEAAAKQAEKDAVNADDGQTTIDERSTTNQGQAAANANAGGAASSNDRRVSASETIDSDTVAMIGSPGLASVPTAHQDGLGDVVNRIMANEPSQQGASLGSGGATSAVGAGQANRFHEDPRPSIGVNSNFSRDEASTPVPAGAHASTLTLDPLLGDSAASDGGARAQAERTA